MLVKTLHFEIEHAEVEHSSCFGGSCPMIKTASDNPLDSIHQKKDHAYLHVIAMGAGDFYGQNNNGDFFYEKDLLEYYKTFESAGVFVQHFNKDPDKSIGSVIKAIYNHTMHRVELIIEIPKIKSPEHYNSIKNGERIKVSMGVKVPQEMCSFCGAITKGSISNRCDHLKFQMHQQMPNGQVVYAINIPPMNFFDISIVGKPADAQGHALFHKVASSEEDTHSEIDKVAELVKYIDAMKSMPDPVSPEDLENMRNRMSPDSIIRVIRAKRIILKPSEAMMLGTDIPASRFGECKSVCDNKDFLKVLLAKLMSSGSCPMQVKTAGVLDYSNEVFDRLATRTELLKTAGDVFSGTKRARDDIYSKSGFGKRRFAQYRVNFSNGDNVVVSKSGFGTKTDIPDYYLDLVDNGYAHSISGILPTGDEALIYKGREGNFK